jgi:hypothetical protein
MIVFRVGSRDRRASCAGFRRSLPLQRISTSQRPDEDMANVYIEARPKGRPEGDPIDDYVVEDHTDKVLSPFRTLQEAIDWVKKSGHVPLVARVRHLNDKKKPDHWRAA